MFVGVNLLFVYFSPSLVPNLPEDFIRGISPCYRTLYHSNLSGVNEQTRFELVYGDSFSEGVGDEFLNGDADYGIFRKLDYGSNRVAIIFARSGYGSHGTAVEGERCGRLLRKFTALDFDSNRVDSVSLVFYEGNDLDDHLAEMNRQSSSFRYTRKFLLPFADYAYLKFREWLAADKEQGYASHSNLVAAHPTEALPDFPTANNGVAIPLYPQAAALELTDAELAASLSVLRESMATLKNRHPESELQFLYLPSIASAYEFSGPLPVQSYRGKPFHLGTGAENERRSLHIRAAAQGYAQELGWRFCDTTQAILDYSRQGLAVHGPRDWKHFNKAGYSIVAQRYSECFSPAAL